MDWNTEVAAQGRFRSESETSKIVSLGFTEPFDFIRLMVFLKLSSMLSDNGRCNGITPQNRFMLFLELASSVNANMGGFGRLRDRSDAM